jgi:molybdopterin molybdotransferase
MLAAQARDLGLVASLDRARDSFEAIQQALERAGKADIVLCSGGVSAGRYDLVPEVLAGLGAKVIFRGVAQKPGKPLLFARMDRRLVFGLPGNPLGSHFCFHRYVAASMRKWMGLMPSGVGGMARLASPLEGVPERFLFQPARVEMDKRGEDGVARWRASPSGTSSSADLFSAATSNAYLCLRPGERAPTGTEVAFEWIGGAR